MAYFAGARLGYLFAIPHGIVAIWPPSGILLGLLLLSPRREWPAYLTGGLVGSVAAHLMSSYAPPLALLASVASVGESLLGAWIVTRALEIPVRLSSLRAVEVFVGGAALLGNGLTAIIGAI